ncbi:MAG TPA: hypothetical protein VFX98_03110 [Longimicrobiaceae bacterium]|nr:hypothetical protein [Longimicrobiaceae bacterium]
MHRISPLLPALAAALLACAGPEGAAVAQPPAQEEHLAAFRQAQARSAAGEWAQAAPLWERVVETNPYGAFDWYELGRAHFNAGGYRASIPAFEQAVELGGRPHFAAFNLARGHAELGETEAALRWLERALQLGYRGRFQAQTDTFFRSLRADPRFRRLTGVVDVSAFSRDEGWRYDVGVMVEEIERMHHRPWHKIPRERFVAAAEALRADIPRLTDNQIIMRMADLAGLVGDGHTGIPPQAVPRWENRALPLLFYLFPEGVYLTAADSAHADLVGARVLRIGGRPVEQVVDSVGKVAGEDNARGWLRKVAWQLRWPQVLNGLGFAATPEALELAVRDRSGRERTVTVRAEPTPADFDRITGRPGWIHAFQAAPGPDPLYLKQWRTNYWFEHLPEHRMMYFQFNLVRDMPAEPFAAFVERLFRAVDSTGVRTLVIDMRWNNGGNTLLLPPLIDAIVRTPAINRPGGLFVIAGRNTYSAAMNAATYLERSTAAIFVGEPTSSSPNYVGEDNFVMLPYSRVSVGASDLFWQASWPFDRRTWIAPRLLAPPTWEAFRSKRDPALEAILAYREPVS